MAHFWNNPFLNPVTRGPGGAFSETGVFEHEGRTFTAGGAFYDPTAGVLFGYPTRTATGWVLTQFDGKPIVTLTLKSTFKGGFGRQTMYAWSARYDGRTFSGRNSGEGMLLRMRAR